MNDAELDEHIRKIKRNMMLLEHLLGNDIRGSLEDCLQGVEYAARDAARRLRQLARERQ